MQGLSGIYGGVKRHAKKGGKRKIDELLERGKSIGSA